MTSHDRNEVNSKPISNSIGPLSPQRFLRSISGGRQSTVERTLTPPLASRTCSGVREDNSVRVAHGYLADLSVMSLPTLYSNEAKYRKHHPYFFPCKYLKSYIGNVLEEQIKAIEQADKKYEQISVMTVLPVARSSQDVLTPVCSQSACVLRQRSWYLPTKGA